MGWSYSLAVSTTFLHIGFLVQISILSHRSRVLQFRRLTAYFEMCLSARRRIGSTVSRLRVYSIVFPILWLVTSPQNARHLRLWEAMVCSILRASEISLTFFGPFLSRFRMPTRLSFERALNSIEAAVTSGFRRVSFWLMKGLLVIRTLSTIKLIEPALSCSKLI